MTYTAIDCQGFAGGFTLGMVQAGFELVAKREHPAGFGAKACLANRHLLGDGWQLEMDDQPGWTAVEGVDVVFGNPPCSGWSVASNTKFRGADSPINHCQWDFARYVARCRPRVAAFESVTQAFAREDGLAMMRQLRDLVEYETGREWYLTHIKHDAYALGGIATRRRYFWLVSQEPFQLDPSPVRSSPTLWDGIGDLSDLPLSWEPQPYGTAPVSPYAAEKGLRGLSGLVDGHQVHQGDSLNAQRIAVLFDTDEWAQGETWFDVLKRVYETHGALPPPWTVEQCERFVKNEFAGNYFPVRRWIADQPGWVIHGGMGAALHPTLPRMMTHREVARVMGFPDTWTALPWAAERGGGAFWGKGITVHCGRWLGEQITRHLDQNHETAVPGVQLGEREQVYDVRPWQPGKERAPRVARAPRTARERAVRRPWAEGMALREGTFDTKIIREQESYRHAEWGDRAVLDLGGNIGAFARYALHLGALGVRSVEPEPQNLELLRTNTEGLPVEVVPAAVMNETGSGLLAVANGIDQSSHSMRTVRGRDTLEVATVALSELVTAPLFEQPITAVKCDIEGGEFLLDWAALPPSVDLLVMELHLNVPRARTELVPALCARFAELGWMINKDYDPTNKYWCVTRYWRR